MAEEVTVPDAFFTSTVYVPAFKSETVKVWVFGCNTFNMIVPDNTLTSNGAVPLESVTVKVPFEPPLHAIPEPLKFDAVTVPIVELPPTYHFQ